jgi:peptidoglycan/xylan/chitin deacetylase (PgdA/CDA1 family)
MDMRTGLMKTGLTALSVTGTHKLMKSVSQGLGLILTMHRVRPQHELDATLGAFPQFNPNGLLEITPEFLDTAISALKADGLSLVSLDEAVEALKSPVVRKGRFAALTFDDGFIDNRDHALPVLEAHNAPGMLYMPSDYPQGKGDVWWVALEEMIREASMLVRPDRPADGPQSVETAQQKLAVYMAAYWALRALPQDDKRARIHQMAADQGYDMQALCRRLILSTSDFKAYAQHPLISVGAHTMTHRAVSRLDPQRAMEELVGGADWLESVLGDRPKHFAFPYGDPGSAGPRDYQLARDAGFESAVTTRKGMLFHEHRDHLFGLPRVSLNGDYQHQRYVEVFASGAPFLLANKFKKVA